MSIPLNLRTTKGRCSPPPLPLNRGAGSVPVNPDLHAVLKYTRPPLAERACCSGDDEDQVPQPQFTAADGAPTPPVVPDVNYRANTLNLRTTKGRCAPLPLPIHPNTEVPDVPASLVMEVRYTRPPLAERACCSGDDGEQVPTPYFVPQSICGLMALENDIGLFALEDGSGRIALECV